MLAPKIRGWHVLLVDDDGPLRAGDMALEHPSRSEFDAGQVRPR